MLSKLSTYFPRGWRWMLMSLRSFGTRSHFEIFLLIEGVAVVVPSLGVEPAYLSRCLLWVKLWRRELCCG